MVFSLQANHQDLSFFGKHWTWFLLWGIVLLVLGLFAISADTLTTYITVMAIGILFLISGFVFIADSLSFWWGKGGSFFLHNAMGILYLLAGILFIQNPAIASVSITLFLGIFYILLGIARLFFSLSYKAPSWGFTFLNGLITAFLGVLIISFWPASSLIVIGLFVGIDLFFCGLSYIMAALAAKNLAASGGTYK